VTASGKSPSSQTLKREQRLRKTWMFRKIHENGIFAKGRTLNLWMLEEKDGEFGKTPNSKIGIVISRKTHAKANKRNLWKRRIREIFRKNQKNIRGNRAFLIKAKERKEVPAYEEIAEDLLKLLKKLECLKE
jgi:ribonuclease P protein component